MKSLAVFKAPADGYYHIAPLGTFDHPQGIKQVIDKQACEAMVNRFKEEEKQPNFPGLLADFDHFSNDESQSSEAAGWIEDLQNRDDGLYAKIKWSDTGDAAVKGGRFRLVSPVWKHRDCEQIDSNTVRPLRLDGIGLTNNPNIRGMRPLTNREEEALLNRHREPSERLNVGNVRTAADRSKIESFLNKGTSAGALKGWETRHGKLAAEHTGKADAAYANGDVKTGDFHAEKAKTHLGASRAAGAKLAAAKGTPADRLNKAADAQDEAIKKHGFGSPQHIAATRERSSAERAMRTTTEPVFGKITRPPPTANAPKYPTAPYHTPPVKQAPFSSVTKTSVPVAATKANLKPTFTPVKTASDYKPVVKKRGFFGLARKPGENPVDYIRTLLGH